MIEVIGVIVLVLALVWIYLALKHAEEDSLLRERDDER
jgi:hypothetical protein